MPELMSALLFEKSERALVTHRRTPPFAGQWMLPSTLVRDDEAAEDAMRRHAREQFGVTLAAGDETGPCRAGSTRSSSRPAPASSCCSFNRHPRADWGRLYQR